MLAGYQLSGDDAIDAARVFQATLHGFISLKQAGGFGLPVDVDRSFDRLIAGLAGTLGAWTVDQIGTMTTVRAATSHSHPAVTGKPLLWLRAEGPIELFAAMLLFHTTHQSWWLGPKIGAALYNARPQPNRSDPAGTGRARMAPPAPTDPRAAVARPHRA